MQFLNCIIFFELVILCLRTFFVSGLYITRPALIAGSLDTRNYSSNSFRHLEKAVGRLFTIKSSFKVRSFSFIEVQLIHLYLTVNCKHSSGYANQLPFTSFHSFYSFFFIASSKNMRCFFQAGSTCTLKSHLKQATVNQSTLSPLHHKHKICV